MTEDLEEIDEAEESVAAAIPLAEPETDPIDAYPEAAREEAVAVEEPVRPLKPEAVPESEPQALFDCDAHAAGRIRGLSARASVGAA